MCTDPVQNLIVIPGCDLHSQVMGEISLGKHPVQSIDVVNGGRMIVIGGSGRTLKVAKIG